MKEATSQATDGIFIDTARLYRLLESTTYRERTNLVVLAMQFDTFLVNALQLLKDTERGERDLESLGVVEILVDDVQRGFRDWYASEWAKQEAYIDKYVQEHDSEPA